MAPRTNTSEQGLETLIVDALMGQAPSRDQSAQCFLSPAPRVFRTTQVCEKRIIVVQFTHLAREVKDG